QQQRERPVAADQRGRAFFGAFVMAVDDLRGAIEIVAGFPIMRPAHSHRAGEHEHLLKRMVIMGDAAAVPADRDVHQRRDIARRLVIAEPLAGDPVRTQRLPLDFRGADTRQRLGDHLRRGHDQYSLIRRPKPWTRSVMPLARSAFQYVAVLIATTGLPSQSSAAAAARMAETLVPHWMIASTSSPSSALNVSIIRRSDTSAIAVHDGHCSGMS